MIGGDITEKYLLLSSVQIKFTPIRVVCHNTLTMALSQRPALHVAHMGNMKNRVQGTLWTAFKGETEMVDQMVNDCGNSTASLNQPKNPDTSGARILAYNDHPYRKSIIFRELTHEPAVSR